MEPLFGRLLRQVRLRQTPAAYNVTFAGPSTPPSLTTRLPLRPFSSSSTQRDQPKDDEIRYHEVHTVKPDGSLAELQSLWRVRQNVDPQTHTVVLVSEEPPIVRIYSKSDLLAAERKREADAKAAKKLQIQEKEIQVSWSTADGDMATKLQHAKNHLARGDRIMLVFAPRQGSKKRQLPQRMEEIVGHFDKGLEDVAQKWKDDEFKGRVVMSYWAPLKDVVNAVREKVVASEGIRARVKDEKKEQRRQKARADQEAAIKRREEDRLEAERMMKERNRELEAAAQRERERLKVEQQRAKEQA